MVGGALYELVETHAHLEEVEDLDQARVEKAGVTTITMSSYCQTNR